MSGFPKLKLQECMGERAHAYSRLVCMHWLHDTLAVFRLNLQSHKRNINPYFLPLLLEKCVLLCRDQNQFKAVQLNSLNSRRLIGISLTYANTAWPISTANDTQSKRK